MEILLWKYGIPNVVWLDTRMDVIVPVTFEVAQWYWLDGGHLAGGGEVGKAREVKLVQCALCSEGNVIRYSF